MAKLAVFVAGSPLAIALAMVLAADTNFIRSS